MSTENFAVAIFIRFLMNRGKISSRPHRLLMGTAKSKKHQQNTNTFIEFIRAVEIPLHNQRVESGWACHYYY